MVGQVGTNFIANLIPFGVDSSALAPRYVNIVRGQIICCIIGGWCMVPWKVLVSGAVFLSCITGMGIFMGCLVGIMVADYFFISKGNYFIEDLYTSNPVGNKSCTNKAVKQYGKEEHYRGRWTIRKTRCIYTSASRKSINILYGSTP